MLYQLSYIGPRAAGARNSKFENRNSWRIAPSPSFEFPFSNFEMERETGIEPATNSLEGCDSTTELLPHPILDFGFAILHQMPAFLHHILTCLNPKSEIQNRKSTHGGQGRIRTPVARKERQVYSLLPLTARPPVRVSSNSL